MKSNQVKSLYLLRNIIKHELLDERQRAGRTRQTDSALTADRAYEHKKPETLNTFEKVIEVLWSV